jgi:hypothetical protein
MIRGLPVALGWPNVGEFGVTSARSVQAANSLVRPFTTPAAMVGKASERAVGG